MTVLTAARYSSRKQFKNFGPYTTGFMGNLGGGRHYDPTKHMTLEEMKGKSVFYQDVYLDG